MSTSTNYVQATPEPVAVRVTSDTLSVDLADGRTIAVPLQWFPRLVHATSPERNNVRLGRVGLHWPDLDEDVPVEGLLRGERSAESVRSLQRWLEARRRGEKLPIPTLPLPPEFAEPNPQADRSES